MGTGYVPNTVVAGAVALNTVVAGAVVLYTVVAEAVVQVGPTMKEGQFPSFSETLLQSKRCTNVSVALAL